MAEPSTPTQIILADSSSEYSESKFWRTLRRAFSTVGAVVLCPALELYFVIRAPQTPLWAKATAIGALGYLIMPLDMIPDALPGIGWGDDLSIMLGAVRTLTPHITPAIRQAAKTKSQEIMATALKPQNGKFWRGRSSRASHATGRT